MMGDKQVYRDPEGAFELRVPSGWTAEPDEDEGGVILSAARGVGLLHVLAFERDPEEICDPAEELYSFLEDVGIELEEDEVEDLDATPTGETVMCAYISEDEEEEEGPEATYWLHAVACMEGRLIFATYTCPADLHENEAADVKSILRSLR